MIETGTFLQQRYRIDKQIGQGGMGAVYVATDERFGSTVAIKETLCMDDNFRKAIEREARLLNSLKHSALPRVSDHFEEDDGLFIVMEYIPGDDVAAMLEAHQKPFPPEQVLKWADQLLDALDYLHTQSLPVIHRDIKPQNLKINSRGEMILLDFGLAKGNPTDAGHHTAAKSIFGYSRNYASLEQIQGTGTDPRSDLYSLAATLYHLLTGVPPEDALTRAMAVLSQRPDPMVPACAINPAVPRGVAGVLRTALDLNADERPDTAAEMRQMLRDSDKYAHLAASDARPIVPSASNGADKTKLMPEATMGLPPPRPTEVKTEVMPAYLSQVTAVGRSSDGQGNATSTADQGPVGGGRRRSGMAAGAMSLLLVGAAVGGGLYFVKPSVFGVVGDIDRPAEPPASSSQPDPKPEGDVTQDGSSTLLSDEQQTSQVSGSAVEAVPAAPDRPAATTDKAPAAARIKVNPSDKGRAQGDRRQIPEPPPPGADDIVVTERNADGSTTTTRVLRRPGIKPAADPSDPVPYVFDPKFMTPAQKRRLRDAIKAGQMPRAPTPQTPTE